MEDFVRKTLLFDFYGELLTEHQKSIYQEIVFDDFSISEIAREHGISRQSVHDMRKRCEKMLDEYENRLHLVERFLKIRDHVMEIKALTDQDKAQDDMTMNDAGREKLSETQLERIRAISDIILEEL